MTPADLCTSCGTVLVDGDSDDLCVTCDPDRCSNCEEDRDNCDCEDPR